jgi:predicted enzyme related to lactoylglutathione lyase
MAGRVVHYEVPSGDVGRAAGFYSGLFGYEVGPSAMEGFEYRMFQTGENDGGAIMASESPGSGLVVYMDTDDIDASVAKVRELGGTADDKQPVPTHGWFAACKDTEGNSFSLWQSDPNAA